MIVVSAVCEIFYMPLSQSSIWQQEKESTRSTEYSSIVALLG